MKDAHELHRSHDENLYAAPALEVHVDLDNAQLTTSAIAFCYSIFCAAQTKDVSIATASDMEDWNMFSDRHFHMSTWDTSP